MIAITLAGMALIISIVALYYTYRATELANALATVMVNAGIVKVKYLDEMDEGEDE